MLILNIILLIVGVLLIIPVTVFLIQVLSAIFLKSNKLNHFPVSQRPKLAILIPAHNESIMIQQTIKALLPQLNQGDVLLVVADNCTDDTANISKGLGATVIERKNLTQRGKGFALDFGIKYLQTNRPEIVIIVDADCEVNNTAIDLLAASCVHHQRPAQALYLMQSQPDPSLKQRVAAFAWIVKNKVRPLGYLFLGLPCQLMGTGMAFLWADISKADLANGHIVEDMKLGAELASLNKAPLFVPDAVVTSIFPPTQEATNTQRARWEHGHLSIILSEAPKLLLQSLQNKNIQLFGLAIDLFIPPLAVLCLMCVGFFVLAVLLATQPIIVLAASALTALFVAVLMAWFVYGRSIISFKQLCYAPIYALAKIPLYLKFFLNRQVEWVRSKRD